MIRIGTSGWQYQSWKDTLYEDVPKREWLSRYCETFSTVEVNNSFYRLPKAENVEEWAEQVPADFLFAMKMSRYLTHIKRLHDPAEPVELFTKMTESLHKKLGPVLLQLPPKLVCDVDLLAGVLEHFPERIRIAVEFRDDSWFNDETQRLLEKHNAALCVADRDNHHSPIWQTADWAYIRLHHGTASPESCYGTSALHTWAERLTELDKQCDDVFVYFNNDTNSCAPDNAQTLMRLTDV